MLSNEVIKDRFHNVEADSAAGTGYAQLKTEHHVQFLAFEPLDSPHVGTHGQVLATDGEHKPSQKHQPEWVSQCPQPDQQLAASCKTGEDNGTQIDAEEAVDEESTEYTEHDIRPTVYGVEEGELGCVDLQAIDSLLLESTRHIVTEVVAWLY